MGDGVVDELIAFFVFLYVGRLRGGGGGGEKKKETGGCKKNGGVGRKNFTDPWGTPPGTK